ncbi:Hypothetical_protein [Hexamita inflata]|uniref:Hypothetical_protein n=1 Tax=Hexamita inflata TaxID=28002 RepID=A0AA86TQR7_9EUKA|nr:Hypothetical protein HINF_LOCUS10877 [Hexamita inflata]
MKRLDFSSTCTGIGTPTNEHIYSSPPIPLTVYRPNGLAMYYDSYFPLVPSQKPTFHHFKHLFFVPKLLPDKRRFKTLTFLRHQKFVRRINELNQLFQPRNGYKQFFAVENGFKNERRIINSSNYQKQLTIFLLKNKQEKLTKNKETEVKRQNTVWMLEKNHRQQLIQKMALKHVQKGIKLVNYRINKEQLINKLKLEGEIQLKIYKRRNYMRRICVGIRRNALKTMEEVLWINIGTWNA